MLICNFKIISGNPEIVPYGPIEMTPATRITLWSINI